MLPPIWLDDLMRDHIGMNDRQTNMAWRGIIRDREVLRRFNGLMDRQHALSREIEATLYEMLDMLLRAMWQKYPPQRVRIIAGLQWKRLGRWRGRCSAKTPPGWLATCDRHPRHPWCFL